MTDREVVLGTGNAPKRGRVREFVARRSVPQRLGVVGAVLVLATAPFGGLRSADGQGVVPLRLDQKIDLGPFSITIESVKQVGSLPPVIDAQVDGSRLLVIRTTVTNHTDRAEMAKLVRLSVGGKGIHLVAFDGQQTPGLRMFDRNDAVEVPDGELINPGQTYDYALVLKQDPDDDLDTIELKVFGYHFEAEDTDTTLDPDEWEADDEPLAQGHVAVEVAP